MDAKKGEARLCKKNSSNPCNSTTKTSKRSGGIFDLDAKREEIQQLEQEMNKPGFWDNPKEAQEYGKKIRRLKDLIDPYEQFHHRTEDLLELIELTEAEDDAAQNAELERETEALLKELRDFEIRCTLSGEQDEANAFVNIHPGAGGTESCDWASMLMRMILRYCERKGWKVEMVDQQEGDEAGIKSTTFLVKGGYAYGRLRGENGIHRLVRISPFDANKRRHTSFAAIHVMPEIDEEVEVEINEKDLRIDTYRSSGAGGQHVNVTDSAIRITHLPTGIVVACQNERSQHQNRDTAMKILKSRLYQMMMEAQAEKLEEIVGEKRDIAWGNQIRSYVFHPYNMVKDHRTNEERGDVQNVMDGDLDNFIDSYLWASLQGQNLTASGTDPQN